MSRWHRWLDAQRKDVQYFALNRLLKSLGHHTRLHARINERARLQRIGVIGRSR